MKILYVQDSLGAGGAERSNADLWYFLRQVPNTLIKIVLLEHRETGIEKEILRNGFDVVFLKKGNFLYQVKQLKAVIREFEPDLVHSVLWKSCFRTRLAKISTKFYHIESIVNCSYAPIRFQDSEVNKIGLKLYEYIDRFTQGFGVDKFVAITQEVKNHTMVHLKAPSSKIVVIPRGRAKNELLKKKNDIKTELTRELNLLPTDILITNVGRQEYQKGHLVLLEAIRLEDEKLSALKAKFIFCGRKGNATPEIDRFLKKHILKTELLWLGHRDDIKQILTASDIFVFPSLYEGLGGALIEAQAARLPVICSDLKVFEEVVMMNKNAFAFKSGNSKDLSEKLVALANSPEIREKLGETSLENFKEHFLIENINDKMLTLYTNIAKGF